MNIVIIGAGIVGSIYGWALSEAGHHVQHLVRAGRAAPLAEGMLMDILDKRKGGPSRFRGLYRISAVEMIEDPDAVELLVFPGHHYTIGEVLCDIVPRFAMANLLFLTQNWEGSAAIDAVLPRSRYVLGDAKAGGSWRGRELVGAIHSVDLGPASPEGERLACRIAALFQTAGLEAPYHEKMLEYLWVQFATTAGLWPSLVQAGSFEALLKDRKAGYNALAAVRECFSLLERRGIDLDDYPELAMYRSTSRLRAFVALGVIRWMFTFSEWAKRTSSHALSDPREVRAFYFDVLRTAESIGYPMPIFSSYRPVIEAFVGAGLHS
jgi:2-dehydropantoate 2-reductase